MGNEITVQNFRNLLAYYMLEDEFFFTFKAYNALTGRRETLETLFDKLIKEDNVGAIIADAFDWDTLGQNRFTAWNMLDLTWKESIEAFNS